MADPPNAVIRKYLERRGALLDHDVERKWSCRGQPCDQADVDEARCKEPVGARVAIALRALERLAYHRVVMLRGRALKEDVRARVDEEGKRIFRRPSRASTSGSRSGTPAPRDQLS
jgi:hypothetical protein